jgi:hypothetical protein
MDASIPVIIQTRTDASRIFFLGLCTSSDKVEIPSNPMYVKTARDAPVETALNENVSGL